MDRYVAFVRNVMVGRNGLSRYILNGILSESGAEHPHSHTATGNFSFNAAPDLVPGITAQIEVAIAGVLDRREPVFVRALDALKRQVASEPFDGLPPADVHERCVSFTAGDVGVLDLPITSRRGDLVVFAATAGSVYSFTRMINGRPGNPGKLLETMLRAPVTTRNWNTVVRILAWHETAAWLDMALEP